MSYVDTTIFCYSKKVAIQQNYKEVFNQFNSKN